MSKQVDIQHVVIVFNPLAGRGKSKVNAYLAKRTFEQHGWDVLGVISTEYAGHAEKVIVPDWCKKADAIIVVGGDGTLREVVAGLIGEKSDTCLGFVPMGNANVVAREFQIPLNSKKAIDVIIQRSFLSADIGVFSINKGTIHFFLAMIEIGQGAKIVHIVDHLRSGGLKRLYQWWGDLVYLIAGLMSFSNSDKSGFQIRVNGEPKGGKFHNAVFSCMATYSKGWSMTPGALFDDGKLDYVASDRSDFLLFVRQLIASSQRKKMTSESIAYGLGERFKIQSESLLFMQADGDVVKPSDNVSIGILPAAYRILVPSQIKK